MSTGIIFDLDGTLLDTLEDLKDAVNAALEQSGYPQRTLEEVPKEKPKPKTEFGEKTRKVRISDELFTRSAVAANVGKTNVSSVTFRPGDRVKHLMFGEGTVLSAKKMGADIWYEIAFDKVGTKNLMATYAKLTKA